MPKGLAVQVLPAANVALLPGAAGAGGLPARTLHCFGGGLLAAALLVAAACTEPAVHQVGFEDVPQGEPDDAGVVAELDGKPPERVCTPSELVGCVSAYSRGYCNRKGTEWEEVQCPAYHICVGSGECVKAKCLPGHVACMNPVTVGVCSKDGTGYEVQEQCGTGLACEEGECRSSCTSDLKLKTNVGCNYVLVDLGNFESMDQGSESDHPVVVVVSNTSGNDDAHLAIASNDPEGVPLNFTEQELTVPPRKLRTLLLPTGSALLDTIQNRWSWSLVSDQPVTVHLINPENGPDVRSNDATLLFPVDSVDRDYFVMGWRSFWTLAQGLDESGFPKYGFPGYVTVVATASGTTEVTVRPTARVRASPKEPGPSDVPIKAIDAGETRKFLMATGDVLNLALEPVVAEVDLTGSTVHGDKPIAVFASHNCAFVPSIEVKFCDHLEHQLAPVNTWGKSYVADLFQPRAPNGYDVWRVMAAEDETVVSTDPVVPGVSGKILDSGEWLEYEASFAHVIEATRPIQVGHYMTGSNMEGFDPVCGDKLTGIGDPAFTIGVAVNQYLDSYIVLTPPGYSDDYLNIVRKKGAKVMLDGKAVAGTTVPIGASAFELVRVQVQDGVHQIESDEPFGVTAYGYDCDVSYAYPGGMLLEATEERVR